MSADDDMGLDGLLDSLNTPPVEEKPTTKKAPAAKRAPRSKPAPAPEPVADDEKPTDAELNPGEVAARVSEERAQVLRTDAPADPRAPEPVDPAPEVEDTTGHPSLNQNAESRPSLSPADLDALREQLRQELLDELLEERRAKKAEQDAETERRNLQAIEARHMGSQEPGAPQVDPFKLPEVENPDQLPALIHFVTDGFTVNSTVAYRGQEYVPSATDAWAMMSLDEQIERWGEVKFKPGPWDGASFNLNDKALTPEDRARLQRIAQNRLANRLRVAPIEQVAAEVAASPNARR